MIELHTKWIKDTKVKTTEQLSSRISTATLNILLFSVNNENELISFKRRILQTLETVNQGDRKGQSASSQISLTSWHCETTLNKYIFHLNVEGIGRSTHHGLFGRHKGTTFSC